MGGTPPSRGRSSSFVAPLLGGALIVACFALLPGARDFADLPQTAWLETATSALLLACYWRGAFREAPGSARLDRPLIGVGIWCVASLFWTHNHYEWAEDALRAASCAGTYFLASRGLPAATDRRRLIDALVLAGGLVAMIGLGQQLLGVTVIPQVSPPAATFASRNVAASVAVVLFPASAVALIGARSRRAALFPALVAALLLAFVFHTATRSAWLAVGGELVLLAAIGRRLAVGGFGGRWGIVSVSLAMTILLASLGPHGLSSPGSRAFSISTETIRGTTASAERLELPDKARSVSLRLGVWRDTLRLIAAHPFVGVGLGNFKVFYPERAQVKLRDGAGQPLFADHAHNEYLQAAAELGLVGLGLIGWWLVEIVIAASRALRRATAEDTAPAIAAIGLAGLAIDCVFAFPLHRGVTACVGACYLGLLGGAPAGTAVAHPPLRRWAPLYAIIFLAVAAWSMLRMGADRHLFRMSNASVAQDWIQVAEEGRAAARLNPFRSLPLFPWASAEIRRGQYRAAESLLQKIVGDYPYHASALGNLGIAHLYAGDLDAARRCFERVLALDPDSGLAHFNLGQIFERQGRLDDARRQLHQATLSEPGNPLYAAALRRVRRELRMISSSPPPPG